MPAVGAAQRGALSPASPDARWPPPSLHPPLLCPGLRAVLHLTEAVPGDSLTPCGGAMAPSTPCPPCHSEEAPPRPPRLIPVPVPIPGPCLTDLLPQGY